MDIENLIKSSGMFLFIKGSPQEPKCKFTRKLLESLGKSQYRFKHHDILKDERLRQWLKFYSQWPTFPQIFVNGEFVGGVDVVTELVDSGEFE